jgi:hypothetical protein
LKIISVIFLAIIISVLYAGNLAAQYGSVFFVPDTTYLEPNDSTQIDLAVDSYLTGIHCYIVSIGFDTSLIELADVTEGPLLPDVGQTFFFWSPSDGGYDIGSCLLGYGLYADGPGVLATMKFRARDSTGISSLHFTDQEFSDTLLNPIYVLPLYGAIVVTDSLPVDVHDPETDTGLPQRFILYQNFPNPFNSQTTVYYGLSESRFVRIEIYDILARLHDVLVSMEKPAGFHKITWDADGSTSGVYYLRLNTGDYSTTRKMLLIK